jgi:cardiolipin synthase
VAEPSLEDGRARDASGRSPRLTVRRLFGLDRSGPPPSQTQAGQPLRPWTIPNAIGFARLALIPVFLIVALSSADGTDAAGATLFA